MPVYLTAAPSAGEAACVGACERASAPLLLSVSRLSRLLRLDLHAPWSSAASLGTSGARSISIPMSFGGKVCRSLHPVHVLMCSK